MKNILIIDDDERLLFLTSQILINAGFDVKKALSAKDARPLLKSHSFDAIVVDWMMPEESGLDFVSFLKSETSEYKDIPVLMLTAMDNIENKLDGFNHGADDYLTKPFDERELIARLKSLTKKTTQDKTNILKLGECVFNIENGELSRKSQNIHLTSTELFLLRTLCQKPNTPFSREELSKKLGFIVNDRTIDVQITRLRKKIGDNPKNPIIIQTVRHIGYLIIC